MDSDNPMPCTALHGWLHRNDTKNSNQADRYMADVCSPAKQAHSKFIRSGHCHSKLCLGNVLRASVL